jgi:hypothetical protein
MKTSKSTKENLSTKINLYPSKNLSISKKDYIKSNPNEMISIKKEKREEKKFDTHDETFETKSCPMETIIICRFSMDFLSR